MIWFEIIKAVAAVATAVIALMALKNWQRQDKAKREAEFLDALIEATHAFIAEMRTPLTILEMSKIGIYSHAPTWQGVDDAEKAVKGAIAYIEKCGERDAKRMFESLKAVHPSTIKLRSLAAKGQVFKFKDYANCRNDVAMLTWQFDRLEAFAAIMGSTSLNWEHPEVVQRLKDMISLDHEAMHRSIADYNVTLIKFAGDTYERIYG